MVVSEGVGEKEAEETTETSAASEEETLAAAVPAVLGENYRGVNITFCPQSSLKYISNQKGLSLLASEIAS